MCGNRRERSEVFAYFPALKHKTNRQEPTMNNQTSVGGHGAVRADLTQAVEAKMATMKKDQFQTMTFPMLVSNYVKKRPPARW